MPNLLHVSRREAGGAAASRSTLKKEEDWDPSEEVMDDQRLEEPDLHTPLTREEHHACSALLHRKLMGIVISAGFKPSLYTGIASSCQVAPSLHLAVLLRRRSNVHRAPVDWDRAALFHRSRDRAAQSQTHQQHITSHLLYSILRAGSMNCVRRNIQARGVACRAAGGGT
ncbi:unnamed protein product [Pleuronectes platessa]|uniref:Uncharacterized protein n=1 Tax=Pleuronectes platessa TaxID=8262 RepID=A0A9N7VRI4_PLEPL|nr:unnamed protein product [Pleuronectes platessa]